MAEETFLVGTDTFVSSDAPCGSYSAVFEDDATTGYFYALDRKREHMILDAVHIYNVANVVDRDRPSVATILWSASGDKCALLINGYPHAIFDFAARRGYCRTNFPNQPDDEDDSWNKSDHSWSDSACAWLKETSGKSVEPLHSSPGSSKPLREL